MESTLVPPSIKTVIQFNRPKRFIILWLLELLALAFSYGILLLGQAAWDMRHEPVHEGLFRTVSDTGIFLFVIVTAALMNFIWSGYFFSSAIARYFLINKTSWLYPLVLACLVVAHMEALKLMDGKWALSISEPLFLGWGATAAFAIATVSRRIQFKKTSPI